MRILVYALTATQISLYCLFKFRTYCLSFLSTTFFAIEVMQTDEKPEETSARIERIMSHKSVLGMIVATPDSNPLRTNLDSATTMLHTRALRPIMSQAKRAVRDLDPGDDLTALRMRTRTQEYLMATSNGFLVLCMQNLATS